VHHIPNYSRTLFFVPTWFAFFKKGFNALLSFFGSPAETKPPDHRGWKPLPYQNQELMQIRFYLT